MKMLENMLLKDAPNDASDYCGLRFKEEHKYNNQIVPFLSYKKMNQSVGHLVYDRPELWVTVSH